MLNLKIKLSNFIKKIKVKTTTIEIAISVVSTILVLFTLFEMQKRTQCGIFA